MNKSSLAAKVANLPAHLQYTRNLDAAQQKARRSTDREQNLIRFFANTGKVLKYLTFQSSALNLTKSNHQMRVDNRALHQVPGTYHGYLTQLSDPKATDNISARA